MPLGDRITASAGEHGRITGAMAGGTGAGWYYCLRLHTGRRRFRHLHCRADTGYEVEQWSVNGRRSAVKRSAPHLYRRKRGRGHHRSVPPGGVHRQLDGGARHRDRRWLPDSAASIRGGTQVTFTAAPHNGYVFDHWTIDERDPYKRDCNVSAGRFPPGRRQQWNTPLKPYLQRIPLPIR